ncbi:hypothetical protein C4K19_2331 [Pseudomonas chlororaphis subsp. aurantiaca]|nr:hypothetical protein C4K19_2331 [Pseudomonas chlororaphis subsp. aurantiaca]AZD72621.1 hypothetical protein C4K16_2261 [Pseudomonas chlororaphis subsp. aurantiaca]
MRPCAPALARGAVQATPSNMKNKNQRQAARTAAPNKPATAGLSSIY